MNILTKELVMRAVRKELFNFSKGKGKEKIIYYYSKHSIETIPIKII